MKPKMKIYKFGKLTYRSYCKPVGHGYEVGFSFQGKPMFLGNFVHAHEATTWWNKMCKELPTMFKKFDYMPTTSSAWYGKFFGNMLYKSYYNYLETAFDKYTKTYQKECVKDFKLYKKREASFYKNAV